DIASAFPISLNSTSKHIRVLEGAGLVRRNVRGREHILTLDAAPLADAAGWIEHYHRFWSEQLASLDAFVTDRGKRSSSSRRTSGTPSPCPARSPPRSKSSSTRG